LTANPKPEPDIRKTEASAWFQLMARYNGLNEAGKAHFLHQEFIAGKTEADVWGSNFTSKFFRDRWANFLAREKGRHKQQ